MSVPAYTAGAVNWKTTAGAVVKAVGLVLIGLVAPRLMGQEVGLDAVMTPEFQSVLGTILAAVGALVQGWFARDYDKSSQDNKARDAGPSKAEQERMIREVAEELIRKREREITASLQRTGIQK